MYTATFLLKVQNTNILNIQQEDTVQQKKYNVAIKISIKIGINIKLCL